MYVLGVFVGERQSAHCVFRLTERGACHILMPFALLSHLSATGKLGSKSGVDLKGMSAWRAML